MWKGSLWFKVDTLIDRPRSGPARTASPDEQAAALQISAAAVTSIRVGTLSEDWAELIAGRRPAICLGVANAGSAALLPGAFNPLHQAHCEMASVAAEFLCQPVAFELSIENVDKSPLELSDVQRRAAQFPSERSVWLTRAATFAEKAVIFPGATFVIGADTLERIISPRYYGDDERAMMRAVDQLVDQECRFLVFGRAVGDRFLAIGEIALPKRLREICQQVPASKFRMDISSTRLRES